MVPTSKHVFISYSRKDSDAMRSIVKHLREQGIKAWVDNESLIPGTPVWEYEIEKVIIGSFAVLVILSPDAKNSEWVLREITLADEYQKRVFPVIVSGKNVDSIPFRLVTRQFADIRQNAAQGLRALTDAVSSYWDMLLSLEEGRDAAEQNAEIQTVAGEDRLAETAQPGAAADTRETALPEHPKSSSPLAVSATTNALLWIILGWVIGGAVGGAYYYGIDPFTNQPRSPLP